VGTRFVTASVALRLAGLTFKGSPTLLLTSSHPSQVSPTTKAKEKKQHGTQPQKEAGRRGAAEKKRPPLPIFIPTPYLASTTCI
jgi:hypothetical protein